MRVLLLISLLLVASESAAQSYLLFQIDSDEGVAKADWLAAYGLHVGSTGPGNGRFVHKEAKHLRLPDSLNLLKIKDRKMRLWHIDFGEHWGGDPTYQPDRSFSRDFEFKTRFDTVHFLGDIRITETGMKLSLNPHTILAACEKYPAVMRESRFILIRPYEKTDIEFFEPCSGKLVGQEIE